ncbi:MAG: Amuc_1102 family pilus-like protein [Opitutaceae bacterium]
MKTLLFSVAALSALVLSASAQTLVGPGSVKISKIQPTAVKTPEYQITGGQGKRYKLGDWLEVEVEYETKPEIIDELTFKFTILMDKKLLDGDVTYVNIAKDRSHYAVMYISPKNLDRITGGKAFTASSIENVWIEVLKNGQALDKSSVKQGPVPNLPHLPGMVLPKDETPFGPLYYDRYEAQKKTVR